MSLRPITPAPTKGKTEVPLILPALDWVPVEKLRIEKGYQRELTPNGLAVVRKIVRDFSWHRFGTLSVAPIEGDLFAVIDGQHRATALATLGIDRAPAMVNEMTYEERARSFVAINSVNTPVTSCQKYWAAVASGDDLHLAVQAAVEEAKVRVLRYPVPTSKHRAGDTLAASALLKIGKVYGPEVLALSLKMITHTGDGNPGMLVSQTIKACGKLVGEDSRLFNRPRDLLAAASRIDWDGLLRTAKIRAGGGKFQVELDSALRAEVLRTLDMPTRKGARL